MKNKKSLLSVLLAAVLLCACVAGMLIFGVSAEGEAEAPTYEKEYTVDSDNEITAAMSEIAAAVEAGAITEGPVLIDVTAPITETATNGFLFASEPIEVNEEALDITIRGNGNAITINTSEALTTTNDFTFEDVSFTTDAPKLNLGCRNVVFDNFGISGTSAVPRTILLNNGNVNKNSSLTVKSGTYTYCYFSLIDGGYTVAENVKTVLNWEGGTLSAKNGTNPDKHSTISGCNSYSLYSSTVTDTTCETINGEIEINVTGGSIAGAVLLSGNTTVNGVATIKMSGGTMAGNFIGAAGAYGGTPVLNGQLNVDVSNVALSGTFRTAMIDFTASSGSKIFTKIYNCRASNATFLFINGTMKLNGDVEFDIGKFTCTAAALSIVSSNRTNSTRRNAILGGNYKYTFRSGNKISGTVYPMRSSKSASYPLVAKCNMEVIFLGGTYSGTVCDISNVTFTGNRKIEIQNGAFESTVTGGDITLKGGTFSEAVTGDKVTLAGGTIISRHSKDATGGITATEATAETTIKRYSSTLYVNEQDILTIPSNYANMIDVDKDDGIRGYMWLNPDKNSGKVTVEGKIAPLTHVVLDVTDRVVIKVLVPKDVFEHAKEHSGEDFTYYCTDLGVTQDQPRTIDWDEVPSYDANNYYFELPAIGAGNFDTELEIFSSVFSAITKKSVMSFAKDGADYYEIDAPEAAALFKALYDYGLAANDENATLLYDGIVIKDDDVESLENKFTGSDSAPVKFNKATLLMGDAIGIRFKFTPDESLDKNLFKVIIAGEDLVDQGKCVIDVATGTLDFYVNAKSLANKLTVTVSYGEGENTFCLSMNELSVKSIAMAMGSESPRVKATQNFIQATQNYLAAHAPAAA